MYERLYGLFTKEDLNKLNNANILLIGVGGVGSACFEVLIRSGIKNITIIDYDTYEISNLNRQLNSNMNNINKKKIDVLKDHALSINNDINITTIDEFINKESNIDYTKYDYIIDACDSIEAKCLLIEKAYENDVKIISSLGVAKRLDPTKFEIGKMSKVEGDPLGKKLRNTLKKDGFNKDFNVLYSKEPPIKCEGLSSYIGASMTAGLLIADFVIKDLIK